jgi:3-hydroxymyristoyl/3-hydroxydecanoyl-(acyl carrier protein) dehydratase
MREGFRHREMASEPELWFFKDHFPGNPIVPAALLMEFAAQTAGALWMQGSAKCDTAVFVASIDAMKIQSAAKPGDTLEARVNLVRELGPLAQFEFEIFHELRPVARGRITLSRQLADSGSNGISLFHPPSAADNLSR